MLSLALFILLSISLVALCLLRASTRDPMARLKELSSANYDLQQKVKMLTLELNAERHKTNGIQGSVNPLPHFRSQNAGSIFEERDQLREQVKQLTSELTEKNTLAERQTSKIQIVEGAIKEKIRQSEQSEQEKAELRRRIARQEAAIVDYKDDLLYYQEGDETFAQICNILDPTIIRFSYAEKMKRLKAYIEKREENLTALFRNHKPEFHRLACMMSDYMLVDLKLLADSLSTQKYYQREIQAPKILEIRRQTKEQLEKYKVYEYQLNYLLDCFPALADFLEEDSPPSDQPFDYTDSDPIRHFLSLEEYRSLSDTERNQLALDRYVESHKKSKWEIGRDYELSVGYQYEQKGYQVEYFGCAEGLADLGRDLICTKGKTVLVIQCKYWSTEKVIREKHIAQLYGTALVYAAAHPGYDVKPLFVTSTALSTEAQHFADVLEVTVVPNFPFKEFPRIKCNIGHSNEGNTLIYHLPMDQQYDAVKLDKPGEFKAFTVAEAEGAGFRRAYRWHSNE